MKSILTLIIVSFCLTNLYVQGACDVIQFKQLKTISSKNFISDNEFDTSVQILKKLENDKCNDYIIKKNGQDSVIASRTFLFGEICLRKNDRKAVKEYINYMHRERHSAEEQISFSFEKLFVKQPEFVLSAIGNDERLLGQLEWGFVNNHYDLHLTTKNCKAAFFKINPTIKAIYPKYKKQVDYLLNEISKELKG